MDEKKTIHLMDLLAFLETEHRKLLSAKEVARIIGVSYKTVYDWKYRSVKYGIPEETFVKIRRALYLRSDLLKNWIIKFRT